MPEVTMSHTAFYQFASLVSEINEAIPDLSINFSVQMNPLNMENVTMVATSVPDDLIKPTIKTLGDLGFVRDGLDCFYAYVGEDNKCRISMALYDKEHNWI